MKCFYHSADLDGKCSAAIMLNHYPKIEIFPINYGDPFPWDTIVTNEVVYMVDFSLPITDMIRLKRNCSRLVWIDHHITAIKESEQSGEEFAGIQRSGIGACALVWEYLYGEEKLIPQSVRLLAEYDVWDHSDPEALSFQYGMRAVSHEPDKDSFLWRDLFQTGDVATHVEGARLINPSIDRMIEHGIVILEYIASDNAGKAKTLAFDTALYPCGEKIRLLAANYGPSNSQFFDSIWDQEKYDAMCLFYWKPRIKRWIIGLYTTRDDVHVGDIAKHFGGGGHPQAAGFQTEENPFVI